MYAISDDCALTSRNNLATESQNTLDASDPYATSIRHQRRSWCEGNNDTNMQERANNPVIETSQTTEPN
jgi:hypothetical protein